MPSLLDLDLFLRKDNNQSKFTPQQVLALYAIIGTNGLDDSWKVTHSCLCTRLSLSDRHLRRTLKPLIDSGFIITTSSKTNTSYTVNSDTRTWASASEMSTPGRPCPSTPGRPCPGVKKDTIYIKEKNKEYIKEKEKEKEKEMEEPMENDVIQIFKYWAMLMNHSRSHLDEKRKKVIRQALKIGYTVDDLKSAILGCSKSEFHMGENDRHAIYDDIELILRDAKHIDGFMKNNEMEIKPHEPKLTRSQQSVKNGMQFLSTLKWVN